MKKLLICAALLSLTCFAYSQARHFVYIESAGSFFVKMADRTLGSGSSGFVILSGLADSTYLLRIGFPDNRFPDQLFTVALNGLDHGYVLKASGEGEWTLSDLQTSGILTSATGTGTFRSEPRKVSPFTMTLSRATDDPSLLFTTVRLQQALAYPVTALPSNPSGDTTALTTAPARSNDPSATAAAPKPAGGESPRAPGDSSGGTRDTVLSVAEGRSSSPADTLSSSGLNGKPSPLTDTVSSSGLKSKSPPLTDSLSSPGLKSKSSPLTDTLSSSPLQSKSSPVADTLSSSGLKSKSLPLTDTLSSSGQAGNTSLNSGAGTSGIKAAAETFSPGVSTSTGTANPPVQSYRRSTVRKRSESSTTKGFGLTFTDEYDGRQDTIRILIPPASGAVNLQPARSSESVEPVPSAVNCRSIASGGDMAKASRRMKVASDEQAMLDIVEKLLRSVCVTSSQVLEFSRFFAGDGGRYKLFRLAYPHVSDPVNFPALASELKDEYFIKQFQAILR